MSQKVNGARSRQIDRIASKRAKKFAKFKPRARPMRRKEIKRPRIKKIIAYDLETTRIEAGTPRPLYITAYGEDFQLSGEVIDLSYLAEIIKVNFLTDEMHGTRFVAWNGNKFDCYFIAAALLRDTDYIIKPYLTKSKSLRGMKVMLRSDKKLAWEFLDGMAMLGLQCTLDKFLENFAPDFRKLQAPDWEKENFNAKNPDHVKYAERDSEGLYHGMMAAQKITLDAFNIPLQPTIGNMGIKIFQSKMSIEKVCWPPGFQLKEILREHVMRGGFCHRARKYFGPVWKYDINQAYAAAMRDAWMPSGSAFKTRHGLHPMATCGVFKTWAVKRGNTIPFYCRDHDGRAFVALDKIEGVWLTSIEVNQLRAEGWQVTADEGYFWDDRFNMKTYVDELEFIRVNAPGGVNGPQGTMMKSIGNNSYGKVLESLDALDLLLSLDQPDGYYEYQGEDELLQHCWFRFTEPLAREFHQPQVGCFITAHVRMQVRRAILLNPGAWLYADTDCVMFDCPVALDIDPKRYGAWKIEEDGEEYYVISKKVYASADVKNNRNRVIHAKGINVNRLTPDDMIKWFNGVSPIQRQVQRQNFVKVMTGSDMFAEREKVGQIF